MGEFKIERFVVFFSSNRGRLFNPCFYASMCRFFDAFDGASKRKEKDVIGSCNQCFNPLR